MGVFHFRQFDIDDHGCGMKICSDSVTFGAWFMPEYTKARTVLDIGAGSGLLSLMAAQYMCEAKITGIEIDSIAANASIHNFANSPWAERLDLKNIDFSFFESSQKVDIIISNPPFFTSGLHAPDKRRAIARHETALTVPALLAFARQNLNTNGHLGLILPVDRTDNTIFEAELAGLKLRRLCSIVPREGNAPVRVLFDLSPTDGACISETIIIRNTDGKLNDRYISLVQPFYTKIS